MLHIRTVIAFLLGAAICLIGPSLLAQATTVTPTAGGVPIDLLGENWAVIIWAYLSTTGIEWVKRHPKIAAFSVDTVKWLQRAVGIVIAVAATAGIHFAYDADAGTFMATGLTVAAIAESFRQFIVQEISYRVLYRGADRPVGVQP